MKTIKDLVFILVPVLLLGITAALVHNNMMLKEENSRVKQNLDQYGREISNLELTKKELKAELEKKNSTIVAVDSILSERNLRISQLERVIATRVTIIDADTTFLPIARGVPVYLPTPSTGGQLYKTVFKTERNCISFEGFILSTDPEPSVAITRREAKVSVYNIDVKRRWWQFWKPRKEKVVSSECGEVEINEIYVD